MSDKKLPRSARYKRPLRDSASEAEGEYTVHRFMADKVREIAESFLQVCYGDRCDTYEYNCECCQRWEAMDRLLTEDSSYQSLQKEIELLKESLAWREEMIRQMTECDEHNRNSLRQARAWLAKMEERNTRTNT